VGPQRLSGVLAGLAFLGMAAAGVHSGNVSEELSPLQSTIPGRFAVSSGDSRRRRLYGRDAAAMWSMWQVKSRYRPQAARFECQSRERNRSRRDRTRR